MGQYHFVCNYDKKEYLHPHKFDDGLKLMEFGASRQGTMLGLAVLLAASNKGQARGGGDIHPWLKPEEAGYQGRSTPATAERAQQLMDEYVGRWAGDRIAIIGDYCEPSDANGLVEREGSPWDGEDRAKNGWTDISATVLETIELDYYTFLDHSKKLENA